MLSYFIAKAIPYVITALGAFAAIGAAWLTGRRAGASRIKAKQDEATIEAHEVRNEVENRIARERDNRQRLHDKWQE